MSMLGAEHPTPLDRHRPQRVRDALVSGRLRLERARAAAEALGLVGLPAAVLAAGGRPVVVNSLLAGMMPHILREKHGRLALAYKPSDALLAEALPRLFEAGEAAAIPLPSENERPPAILYLVPNREQRADLFAGGCS